MSGDIALPVTPTEKAIARVWERVLGFEPIGRDDTFADLGGTSLAAERALAEVQRTLAVDLTPAMLVGHPTVAQIAERLDESGRSAFGRRTPDYVCFPGTDVAPIFCVVGAGSSAVAYVPLINHLRGQRTVYAFQQHGFFSRGRADWTVSAQARRHLRDLRRIQPTGPYTLVGHSYGAHVALEMGHMLSDQGERVDRVIALDPVLRTVSGASVADFAGASTTPPLSQRLRTHARIALAGLIRFDPATQQSIFWERGIRAQNRHRVTGTPPGAVIVVTDENAAQEEFWRTVPGDRRIVRVPGTHIEVMSSPRALDVVRGLLTDDEPAR